jgi:hypothetical protein
VDSLSLLPNDLLCIILESLKTIREVDSAITAIPQLMAIAFENCLAILPGWNSTASPIFQDFFWVKSEALCRWLEEKLLKSCIVSADKLFAEISSKKKSGFVTEYSSLSSWNVTLRASDKETRMFSWVLVYRASLFGFAARESSTKLVMVRECLWLLSKASG